MADIFVIYLSTSTASRTIAWFVPVYTRVHEVSSPSLLFFPLSLSLASRHSVHTHLHQFLSCISSHLLHVQAQITSIFYYSSLAIDPPLIHIAQGFRSSSLSLPSPILLPCLACPNLACTTTCLFLLRLPYPIFLPSITSMSSECTPHHYVELSYIVPRDPTVLRLTLLMVLVPGVLL